MRPYTVRHHLDVRHQHDPLRRRLLLALASGTAVGAAAALLPWARAAGTPAAGATTVRVVAFSDDGRRIGEQTLAKVIKSEREWRALLSPESFEVTRRNGTEAAFSGDHERPEAPGIFRCICCGNALYDAATEFDSGTGWPSFWQPIAAGNVTESVDTSFFSRRTAISCTLCDAHLGHVFNDGPPPTGLRYCMNSVALRFAEKREA